MSWLIKTDEICKTLVTGELRAKSGNNDVKDIGTVDTEGEKKKKKNAFSVLMGDRHQSPRKGSLKRIGSASKSKLKR